MVKGFRALIIIVSEGIAASGPLGILVLVIGAIAGAMLTLGKHSKDAGDELKETGDSAAEAAKKMEEIKKAVDDSFKPLDEELKRINEHHSICRDKRMSAASRGSSRSCKKANSDLGKIPALELNSAKISEGSLQTTRRANTSKRNTRASRPRPRPRKN